MKRKLGTVCVHAGEQIHPGGHGAIVTPIVTASSFISPGPGSDPEFCYARCQNPTRLAYETALAELEAGACCCATASGLAAISLALDLLPSGAHVLVHSGVYGGTHRLFETVRRPAAGNQFSYVDLTDLESARAQVRPETAMIWAESPTNPLLQLLDLPKICSWAAELSRGRAQPILVGVDNTFCTGWNQQPLSMGAHLSVLSTSKYIGGHSDLIGGAVVVNEPELAARARQLSKAVGAVQGPFDCYLALRGMKTLAIRLERQSSNALRLAEWLTSDANPLAGKLAEHELCKAQMRSGGAVVTVRLWVAPEMAEESQVELVGRFVGQLKVWTLAESLGGVESMVNHSASMSHGGMSREQRAEIGIFDTTLRLSVGIEDVEDLIQDIQRGLEAL